MNNLSIHDELNAIHGKLNAIHGKLNQAIDQLMLANEAREALPEALGKASDKLASGDSRPDVAELNVAKLDVAELAELDVAGLELAELIEVAADLRHLPRPEFKMRLKLELDWQASGRLVSAGQNLTVGRHKQADDKDQILPTLFGAGRDFLPGRSSSFAASVGVHAGVALLIVAVIALSQKAPQVSQEKASTMPLVTSYKAPVSPSGGAGGGGGAEKTDASKGALPPSSREQLTPPVVIAPQESRLHVQPTIVAVDPTLPKPDQIGDPLASLMAPSNGRGLHGGIGDADRGGGIGNRPGIGYGPGGAGGLGGLTAPRVIYNPDPDFSEEARKAKYQGTVMLWAIIGADGRARDIRVQQSLGMGLDEKAVEALRTWRFQPGMLDGRPVAVEISVEVNFRLF